MSADLLRMQAPQGVPLSNFFDTVTDPLLPPSSTSQMLDHFPEQVYDLSAESHVSRLLKVILGDTGTGQLRKRYAYSHMSQYLLTSHYYDLDHLYAEVFGLKRLFRERLDLDVYNGSATDEEWERVNAADASYRARVEAFSRAIALAGTPTGLGLAASAVLGSEVRVYESYEFLDNADAYAAFTQANTTSYEDLNALTFGDLQRKSYSELEGRTAYQARLPNSRGEVIIRPLRPITAEENYHLVKVLERLKPAGCLLSIDTRQSALHSALPVARATSSSTYWHVQHKVQIAEENAGYYANYVEGEAVQQPRPAFSQYQGEAWNYNADAVTVSSYVEDEDGDVVSTSDYERVVTPQGNVVDYPPEQALADPSKVLLGRYVSDGILSGPAAVRSAP